MTARATLTAQAIANAVWMDAGMSVLSQVGTGDYSQLHSTKVPKRMVYTFEARLSDFKRIPFPACRLREQRKYSAQEKYCDGKKERGIATTILFFGEQSFLAYYTPGPG